MHLLLVAILPLGDVMPIKIGLCIQSGIRLGWCANREDICLQGHWVPQLPAVRVQLRSTPSTFKQVIGPKRNEMQQTPSETKQEE